VEHVWFLVASVMVMSSGCLVETGSFSLTIVLENRREEPADFRVLVENNTRALVWSWNQSVAPGEVVSSEPVVLPDGLYYTEAFADDAGCRRGPGAYEAAKITWFVELPEFGRVSRFDGTPWPPQNLNCVNRHE